MSQAVGNYLPSGSRVPTGSAGVTIFGGSASIHAALNDSSDTTGVHLGTTYDGADHRFITTHNPGLSALGVRVDLISVVYRSRYLSGFGWIYPRALVGLVGGANGVRHELPLSSAAFGAGAASVTDAYAIGSSGAADGTPWNDCDRFEVEWSYVEAAPWSATTYPYLTGYYLQITYTQTPIAASIEPTGTVTTSRPALSWAIANGPQTAFQVAVVSAGSTDANGHSVGDSGFDPLSASGLLFDSGKTYSSSGAFTLTQPVPNGTLHFYVKVWSGTGALEREGTWTFRTLTISVPTVDAPTVTLSDDTASNTLKVQIDPGAHVATNVAAAIQVQYLNGSNVWVDAPIPGGIVSGSSSSIFYDGTQPPGLTTSYRARGIAVGTDGFYVVSGWVVATHTVANPHQHWLRSTVDYTLNRSLSDGTALLLRTWQPKRTRPAAVSYGIGATLATVVHDVTKADTHSMSVWAQTSAAYNALRALLDSEDDLIFVSEWGETRRVQVVGDVGEEIVRAAPRSSESTPLGHVRIVNFSLVEVVAP
jgi:hypothetical protein